MQIHPPLTIRPPSIRKNTTIDPNEGKMHPPLQCHQSTIVGKKNVAIDSVIKETILAIEYIQNRVFGI